MCETCVKRGKLIIDCSGSSQKALFNFELCHTQESGENMARSLQKEARLLCPPLSPRVCSNSCPLSGWCCLTISSSAAPFFFDSWHQVPKYWSFSFRISPSNEYLGLISFRIDWFDLFAVPGTLKNLLQHHNLKASNLRLSACSVVQLSHLYWKNYSFDDMDLCWQSDISAF